LFFDRESMPGLRHLEEEQKEATLDPATSTLSTDSCDEMKTFESAKRLRTDEKAMQG
jgi:hypothetical protein